MTIRGHQGTHPTFPTYADIWFLPRISDVANNSHNNPGFPTLRTVRTPTPRFRRIFRYCVGLLCGPLFHPSVFENGLTDDVCVLDEPILQMDAPSTPLVDFLDFDDTQKRLLFQ